MPSALGAWQVDDDRWHLSLSKNRKSFAIHDGNGGGRRKYERERLAGDEILFDFMLNALRLNAGFSEELFVQRTGVDADELMRASDNARRRGLIERDNRKNWRPTDLGARFLNDLQAEFIPN